MMKTSCYNYALKYLSRYPKTSHDLDMQLKKKGYEEEEREETIVRLEEIGLLDDRNYAEQYLRSEVVEKREAVVCDTAEVVAKRSGERYCRFASRRNGARVARVTKEKTYKRNRETKRDMIGRHRHK